MSAGILSAGNSPIKQPAILLIQYSCAVNCNGKPNNIREAFNGSAEYILALFDVFREFIRSQYVGFMNNWNLFLRVGDVRVDSKPFTVLPGLMFILTRIQVSPKLQTQQLVYLTTIITRRKESLDLWKRNCIDIKLLTQSLKSNRISNLIPRCILNVSVCRNIIPIINVGLKKVLPRFFCCYVLQLIFSDECDQQCNQLKANIWCVRASFYVFFNSNTN